MKLAAIAHETQIHEGMTLVLVIDIQVFNTFA